MILYSINYIYSILIIKHNANTVNDDEQHKNFFHWKKMMQNKTLEFFSFYSFFFLHQDRMKLLVFFIFSEKNSWNIFLIYFFFFLSCLQVCVFDIIFLHSCFFFIINVRRMDVRSTKWLLNLNSSKLLSFNYFQLI